MSVIDGLTLDSSTSIKYHNLRGVESSCPDWYNVLSLESTAEEAPWRAFFVMAENQQVPKFAHLEYRVLHELEISIAEYFMLDMIFRLSGNGRYWCNKKLINIAADMRLSKRGVTDMRDRLVERKLLLKGIGNRLRTSEKVQKVYFLDESELTKSAVSSKKMQKVHLKSAESVAKTPVENNRRLTLERGDKDFRGETPGPGKAFALKKLEEIRKRANDKMRPSYHA